MTGARGQSVRVSNRKRLTLLVCGVTSLNGALPRGAGVAPSFQVLGSSSHVRTNQRAAAGATGRGNRDGRRVGQRTRHVQATVSSLIRRSRRVGVPGQTSI